MATGDKTATVTFTHNGAVVQSLTVVLLAPLPPGPVAPPIVTVGA